MMRRLKLSEEAGRQSGPNVPPPSEKNQNKTRLRLNNEQLLDMILSKSFPLGPLKCNTWSYPQVSTKDHFWKKKPSSEVSEKIF